MASRRRRKPRKIIGTRYVCFIEGATASTPRETHTLWAKRIEGTNAMEQNTLDAKVLGGLQLSYKFLNT